MATGRPTKYNPAFCDKDEKLQFSFKAPYDVLLLPKYRQDMLALVDDFRTFDWVNQIKYPLLTFQKSGLLLSSYESN